MHKKSSAAAAKNYKNEKGEARGDDSERERERARGGEWKESEKSERGGCITVKTAAVVVIVVVAKVSACRILFIVQSCLFKPQPHPHAHVPAVHERVCGLVKFFLF